MSARVFELIEAGNVAELRGLLAVDPSLAASRRPDGTSAVLWARYQFELDAVEALLHEHAVVSIIGPGKPITDVPASQVEGVVDAADDAFVEGIRAALAAAGALALVALAAGFFLFPKGRREAAHETTESLELASEESAG